jgi:hypothetical protein
MMENGAFEDTYSMYGAAANYDYPQPMQGRYAKSLLARVCMDARKLHDTLGDDDRIPAWVIGKVATANDRLHMASDYLRYKAKPGIAAFDYSGVPDGSMIRQTLKTIEREAAELHALIKDSDHVAPWVPKFVYTAQDRLGVISEYIKTAGANYKGYSGPVDDIGEDLVKGSKVILGLLAVYIAYDFVREKVTGKA